MSDDSGRAQALATIALIDLLDAIEGWADGLEAGEVEGVLASMREMVAGADLDDEIVAAMERDL